MYTVDRSQCEDGATSRLYLDIEWLGEETEDAGIRVRRITESVHTLARQRTDGINTEHVIEDLSRMTGDGWKHSYHIHYTDIVFPSNGDSMRRFVDEVIESDLHRHPLLYAPSGRKKTKLVIDRSIYTRGRHFRLPGSHKAGDAAVSTLPSRDVFMACLTTGCSRTDFVSHMDTTPPIVSGHDAVPQLVPVIQTSPEHQTTIDRLHGLLAEHGDTTTRVTYSGVGTCYRGTNGCDGRVCLIDGCTKQRNNCYLIIRSCGDVYYHCFGSSGYHEACAGINIGTIHPTDTIRWDGDEFAGVCSVGSDWRPSLDVLVREHDDEYVQPYTLEFGRQVLLCIAGMGMGKTYQAKKLIHDMRSGRILYVVPRRSLATAVHALLTPYGFMHYSEGVRADRLIIEYESLHRLNNGECAPFDLVIMDEIRSICRAMTTVNTNGTNIHHNQTILRTIATNCGIVVGMDADAEVDPAVSHLLQTWWPRPSTIQVERYTRPKLKRNIYTMEDEDAWVARIADNLGAGKTCSVCCRTKRRAKAIASSFSDKYNVKLITGDTSDIVSNEFLRNPDTGLAGVDLFVFTSKINIGVDIQLDWDCCFIDGYGRNGHCCGARDLVQMCGRFRRLRDPDVYTLVKTSTPKFTSPEDLFDEISAHHRKRRDVLDNQYRKLLSFSAVFDDGYLRMAPTWITLLFIYCDYESFADFTYELFRVSKLKQYKVYRVRDASKASVAIIDHITASKEHDKSFEEQVFLDLKGSDYENVIEESDISMRAHTASVEDVVRRECACVMKYLDEAATYDQFVTVKDNIQQLRNIKRVEQLTSAQLLRMEINTLHKHSWADQTLKTPIAQFQHMDECLRLLGVEGINDTTTTFTSADMDEHSDEIFRLCEASASMGRRRGVRRGRTPTTVSLLRRELKALYGLRLVRSEPCRRGEKIHAYHLEKVDSLSVVCDLVNFGYGELDDAMMYTDVSDLHATALKKRKFNLLT